MPSRVIWPLAAAIPWTCLAARAEPPQQPTTPAAATSQGAAEWKPAAAPLATRWTAQVDPSCVWPEYPRPQMVRQEWLNLNGLWEFALAQAEQAPPLGRALRQRILVPFCVESALSGIMQRAQRVWYRRTFDLPESWRGRRVLLHFGAVDWEARVWLNGQELGIHRGGYDAFSFDITPHLRPSGPQELVVGVYDPTSDGTQPRGKQVNEPQGIYYTPTTGIWQTVWLEPVPEVSIESLRLVPDVEGSCLRLVVQCRGGGSGYVVRAAALMDGETVARAEAPVGEECRLVLKRLRLWSPDDPFLYDLRVSVHPRAKPTETRDEVQSYFGMRSIGVRPDEHGTPRIELNGRPVFLVGLLDQGFWPDGLYTAPTEEALRYDIEVTKQLGFNLIRKHVKVEPARWYYWCDRLGVVVWQDMPSGDASVGPGQGEITRSEQSARQFELELERMLRGLQNHPCITQWVVFNEGWGQYDTQRLTQWVKQFDPTRLVTCASGWNDLPVGDVIDVHVYPGPGVGQPDGKRALVLGEFGGLGLGIDGHTWTDKTWGYRGTADRKELTLAYVSLLRACWALHQEAGLCAAVYTQTTDVETEANGLLTYDREIIKVDMALVAAANRGRFPAITEWVATSRQQPQTWRYTFHAPPEGWEAPQFDDTGWQQGAGGFGTQGTPGAIVRTEWNSQEIWLRREFEVDELPAEELLLSLHHDEDVEVYLNGVLAAAARGYTTRYVELPLRAEALAALRRGRNVLAVHCRQTGGGQYIDVGLVRYSPPQAP
ncbi:MAG: glycoside hydrolase family 2 [Pirellulales bacterium]|nr:glycoside hydrolase family 2 [Pirellulales bacterium]